MKKLLRYAFAILGAFVVQQFATAAESGKLETPRVVDDRLEVICFASSPEIVHPISIDFDSRGRLLVIESHTHFRPTDYQGPATDRIRMLEDTDGDGRADKFTTFYEGSTATMDLATARDGSVYVASRSEIFRLIDKDGDGQSDEKQSLVKLVTAGNYPHNGLSGLAFDYQGNLWFGMGENLGASYELVGSDGSKIVEYGEGGNVFRCTAAGGKLRRVATGFWNPFGLTIDVFGRVWAVDNDPDSSPPCRLLHVIDGGNYGYQFRYGRSGRHPFQSWNGQLPGTLPMVSGTGEAPCEVLSYESDGLPEEYLGDLLVTSWADHRVERYRLQPRGASYVAERKPFVQGGTEFRPVGLATAPDGSLYFSDWVRRDYNLHHQGAVWHLRQRDAKKPSRPTEPSEAFASLHRPLRERAARQLAATDAGRASLRDALKSASAGANATPKELRQRATALQVLANDAGSRDNLARAAQSESNVALRAYAIAIAAEQGIRNANWADAKQPAPVRLSAIAAQNRPEHVPALIGLLADDDPFLQTAAVQQLATHPALLEKVNRDQLKSSRERIGLLLAQRAAGMNSAANVATWLSDADENVRFMAAKWVSDLQLSELRPQVASALEGSGLSVRMYQALATALSRIDGEEVSDAKMADFFVKLLKDDKQPAERRATLLRLIPASHKQLTLELVEKLANQSDRTLQLEAVRTLAEHPSERRLAILATIAKDNARDKQVRAEALVGLAAQPTPDIALYLQLAQGPTDKLRAEALRALVGVDLSTEQQASLQKVAQSQSDTPQLVARALNRPAFEPRPDLKDTAAWLKLLSGDADAENGRRVFFHPKLAGCFRCHRVEGHGQTVGPDLSLIGTTERRHILESILQPSAIVAPHFQVWQMIMNDGQSLTGMLVHTQLDEYTYLDPQGKLFKVRTVDVAETYAAPTSIMPANLTDRLTDQELRDLLAFLTTHR